MKARFVIFYAIVIPLIASCQQSNLSSPIKYKEVSIEEFSLFDFYDHVLKQLESEDRINTDNAMTIKMVSSNSFVAFEQSPDSIISENGKLQASDIEIILKANYQQKEMLIIITVYKGFCHAFKYIPESNQLKRFKNIGSVNILGVDSMLINNSTSQGISFYAKNEYMTAEDWVKYFFLNIETGTFTHTENCRIINQKRECKTIEHNN